MIQGIIFDIGSTLTINHWRKRIRAVERETGVSLLNDPTLKNDITLGKTSLKEYLKRSREKSGSPCALSALIQNYKKNYVKYAPVDTRMRRLIRKVRKSYRVYAFSNTNDIHTQINKKRGVYKDFHKTFLSCEIGLRKPKRKAFAYVIQKIGLPSQSLVFIDDDKENIRTAAKVGMIAIHYKNYQKLITRLKKLGVKGL